MNKHEYIDRAYKEIERAEARIPTYAGDCKDCRWSRGTGHFMRCGHGAVECAAFNLTDSYDREAIQRCGEQRDRESIYGPVLCGPDGALFEAKK